MKLHTHDDSPTFGADSGRIFKSWEINGSPREFRGLISVVVNPRNQGEFEDYYDTTLKSLFEEFNMARKRMVYKAYDIYKLFTGNPEAAKLFVRKFGNEIFNSPQTRFTYVYTHINAKALAGRQGDDAGRVTIHGEYGSPTRYISANAFMDKISPYHHLLASWAVADRLKLKGCRIWLDGLDRVDDCQAYRDLTRKHRVSIVSKGDQTMPILSTSDLLVRYALNTMRDAKSYVDENVLARHLDPDKKLDNLYFMYLGNPQLNRIRPLTSHPVADLHRFESHPIIFVSAGGIPGFAGMFEDTDAHEQALKHAAGLGAGVRYYEPKKDRPIIGKGDHEDYFMALNDPAKHQLQALASTGRKVKELNPAYDE